MVTKKEKNNAEKLQEKKDFRNKIIGLIIGILLVIAIVAISTYAYWQLTKKQEDVNSIIAACLDFDLVDIEEDIPSIQLENQWPMNNSDALNTLHGYNFRVVNHCTTAVSYQIALETFSAPEGKSLLDDYSVKVALDDEVLGKFGQLSVTNKISDNALQARNLRTSTVAGNSFNKHNLKLWIADDASVNEQNKVFEGSIFITGGQYITDNNPGVIATSEECFTINDSGTITGYDKSCGKSVVIPATVNEIQVKKIATNAFKEQYTGSNADIDFYFKLTENEEETEMTYDVKIVKLKDNIDKLVEEMMKYQRKQVRAELAEDNVELIDNVSYITKEEASELEDYTKQTIRIVNDFECVGSDGSQEDKAAATFIMYTKDSDYKTFVKDTLNKDYYEDLIEKGLVGMKDGLEYTSSFINSEDDSYLSDGYNKRYCQLTYESETEGIKTMDYNVPVVDSVDFSKTIYLEEIEQSAFLPTVTFNGAGQNEALDYGIKHISFGENDKEIKIGAGAFTYCDLEDLTIYTTYDIGGSPFLMGNIKTLRYEVGGDNKNIPGYNNIIGGVTNTSGLYLMQIDNLIIGEGIESVPSYLTGDTVTLPSTLKGTIPKSAFYSTKTLTNTGIPNGVTALKSHAFSDLNMSELTIPASIVELAQHSFPEFRGTLKIQRTEEDFNTNVQKHSAWARFATFEFLPN